MQLLKRTIILVLVEHAFVVFGMSVTNFDSLKRKQDINNPTSENERRECDCGPNGICSIENDIKKCSCYQGFAYKDGICTETCAEDSGCLFGGRCEDINGSFFCSCKLGLMGDKCETIFDCVAGKYKGCQSSGGMCMYSKYFEKAECFCLHNFKYNKEEKICKECDCGSNGICSFKNGLKKCSCERGFTVKDGKCTAINPCMSMPCQNEGICQQNGSSFNCQCKPPYFGALCEKDPCSENPCQNGGECVQIRYSFKCQCRHPYYGDICQYVDECSDNPCFNGGTCVRDGNSFKCNCRYGYYGINCEEEGYESSTEEPTDSTTEFENTSLSTVGDIKNYTEPTDSTTEFKNTSLSTIEDIKNYTEPTDSTTEFENTSLSTDEDIKNYTEPTHELRNFTFNFNLTTIKPGICATDSDCLNEGVCRYSNCKCQPNFGGFWCEKNFLCERLQSTCRAMGAICKIVGNKGICDCPPDKMYQPKSGICEDICDPWKCVHGRCEIDGRSYKCICDNGYTGYHCRDIVEVKSEPSYVWFAVMTCLMMLICLLLMGHLYIFYRNPKNNAQISNAFPMENIYPEVRTSDT